MCKQQPMANTDITPSVLLSSYNHFCLFVFHFSLFLLLSFSCLYPIVTFFLSSALALLLLSSFYMFCLIVFLSFFLSTFLPSMPSLSLFLFGSFVYLSLLSISPSLSGSFSLCFSLFSLLLCRFALSLSLFCAASLSLSLCMPPLSLSLSLSFYFSFSLSLSLSIYKEYLLQFWSYALREFNKTKVFFEDLFANVQNNAMLDFL